MSKSYGLAIVSNTDNIHVDRFFDLLCEISPTAYKIIVSENTALVLDALMNEVCLSSKVSVSRFLDENVQAVLWGPLNVKDCYFPQIKGSLIGVSWATDLMIAAATRQGDAAAIENLVPRQRGFIVDNHAARNALISMGAPEERIFHTAWGPTKSTEFDNKDSNSPDKIRKILFGRSIAQHYQPELCLKAVEELHSREIEFEAFFLESGPELESFQTLVTTSVASHRIKWVRPQPEPEFKAQLAGFDLLISLPLTDGTSVTMLNAMASHVEVLSSPTNGACEWIIDGLTGWLCSDLTPKGVADKVVDIFSRPEQQRLPIRERARRLSQSRLTWESRKPALIEFISSSVEEKFHQQG